MKRTLIAAVAGAFALTLAQPAPAQDLAAQVVGVWKYTGVTATEVASGKVNKPFGEKPNGQYVFTKGGRFVFSLVGDNRANPVGATVTDAEALALYRTNSHGTGTYKVESSHVTLSYNSSWN